jgi:hypothetical protein
MKCPTCGELWFDSDEEYSIETCDRCVDDPDTKNERTTSGEAAHVRNPGEYGAAFAPAKRPNSRSKRRGR